MKASWNGAVIAESDTTEVVEGNHYFPLDSVNPEYLKKSEAISACPWKGLASYYDIVVAAAINEAAAFYYADPKPEAAQIKNHIAFWKGVEVSS
jgi:uncharacterized protein (DUF427 family)